MIAQCDAHRYYAALSASDAARFAAGAAYTPKTNYTAHYARSARAAAVEIASHARH